MFSRNYTKFGLLTSLFSSRTELLDATGGKLPTVEQIENVWHLPNEPQDVFLDDFEDQEAYKAAKDEYNVELTKYEEAHKLFAWYVCDWLPMAVGIDFWGPSIKSKYLMVDKFKVPMDNSGKSKVYVTVTSEAFGQLMFKNCRAKWLAIWNWRKTHGAKKKVPAYSKDDPSTHVHEGLWSNTKGSEGRVEGSTWHRDGLEYLNERIEVISAIRAEEADTGYDRMKLARTYIQEAMGVEPETRGRTRTAAEVNNAAVEGAVLQKRVKLTVLDE